MSGIQLMGISVVTSGYEGGASAPPLGGLVTTSSLLPDPMLTELMASGDPGAMAAALGVKMGQSEEDFTRKIRDTQTQIQQAEEAKDVAEMHQKASDMRSAAVVGAIIGSASGMLSAGAAGLTDGHAAKVALAGAAKLTETAGQFVKDNAAAHNEDLEADITQHKDNAEAAGTASSRAYDQERDAKKLLDAALDFYREYSSSKDQTQAAALYKS